MKSATFKSPGKGIRESLGKIKPGETSTLTVKLEPGSYTASCPEHRGERMTFKVTGEQDASTAAWVAHCLFARSKKS